MPIYEFICPNCNSTQEVTRPMSESSDPCYCSVCEVLMDRVYSFHAANKDYHKPLVSDSLAIHPDQIPEHNRMFPDVKVTSEGQPILENYAQHEKYLKANGFVKRPGKSRKGKKVSKISKKVLT